MKHSILIFAIFATCCLTLGAQTGETSRLGIVAQKKPVKVQIDKLTWYTNLDDAIHVSQKKGLPILMDFTGSDWCGWCKKLDAEVFSQKEFQDYAAKNLVLVVMDYPRGFKSLPEGEQAYRLEIQTKFNIEGYPTIVLTDPQGKEVARTGYQEGGAAKYVEHLKGLLAPIEEPKKDSK
jgi:protein disulfide-isomerase